MLRGPGRVAFALGGPQRQSARIQVRHSMFLWRHVPLFKTEKEEWRISKKMWKPIKPVRVDGPRGHFPKDCRHGVLLASGFFKPYYGSYGEPFNDVWRNYTEKYEQVKQYRRLRGLSNDYYCPRCDWRMHFLRRVSTKYELIEVEGMKRQIYHRKESIDATEDHTFCPNESCRIDEARIDVRHNVSKIEVIHGCISDTRFQKEKSVDKEHRCQDGNGKNRPEVKEMGRELLEKFENLQQTHPKMSFNELECLAGGIEIKMGHTEAMEIVRRSSESRIADLADRLGPRPKPQSLVKKDPTKERLELKREKRKKTVIIKKKTAVASQPFRAQLTAGMVRLRAIEQKEKTIVKKSQRLRLQAMRTDSRFAPVEMLPPLQPTSSLPQWSSI